MKLAATLILTILAVVSAEIDIVGMRKQCMAETGAKEGVILKASKGIIEDDQQLHDHLACVFKKAGLADDDGKPITKNIIKELSDAYQDQDIAKSIVEDCENELPSEYYKCVQQKTGISIV